MYAQMLVGMVALTGQWWLDVRKPGREEVAAHVVNLAWNGLTGLNPQPAMTEATAMAPTMPAVPRATRPRPRCPRRDAARRSCASWRRPASEELKEAEKVRQRELREAGEGPGPRAERARAGAEGARRRT